MPKLEKLFSYHANLAAGCDVGAGPYGNRLIVEVQGGAFEGPKLKGKIRELGCADWLTICEDYGHLDVRATFETDDGAFIYVEYRGHVELTETVQASLAGEDVTTNYGDQYFFTAPRMQTGDPRYAWVNNIICVGQGKLSKGRVDYDVYMVVND